MKRIDAKKLIIKAHMDVDDPLMELGKAVDTICDSVGTCGECEHWNRRYKKENICFVHDIMKKPSGYCDDFERKEES